MSRRRVEDYLKAIHILAAPAGTVVTASRLADMVGVSRPTVSEMLKRLRAEGWVEPAEGRIVLTPDGRARGSQLVRTHRLLECFLATELDYRLDELYARADTIAHAFSPDMVDRLDARLGSPTHCPHGWPVDPEAEPAVELVRLDELRAGETCTLVRLVEHDSDLLAWYDQAGLAPGSQIAVEEIHPAAGHLELSIDGTSNQRVADKGARGLLVTRA